MNAAFCGAHVPLVTRRRQRRSCCSARSIPKAELDVSTAVTVLVAGVAMGVTGATFENMLNVIYGRPSSLKPNELELCETCAGFGRVRCQVCFASGEINNWRARKVQICPLCSGRKYERCRRCGGRGTTGVKKIGKRTSSL